MKLFVDRKWVLELGVLLFSYVLFILNDWILIRTWRSLLLGIAYYLVLYTHAQLNRCYIVPFLLKKQNVWRYCLLTILSLLLFSAFLQQLAQLMLYQTCFIYNNAAKLTYHYQLGILLGSYICIAGPSLFIEYYHRQKDQADKEILSNKIKIDLLNKQLNPHFLFNTLNNIYGLSIEYPDRTPDAVMKVADLLRYQLENGAKELVALQDEITFIESYIAIEKDRIGYRCQIQVQVSIDQVEQYFIAPMILFTFIENAFKHGTNNINGNVIDIIINATQGILELKIRNTVAHRSKVVSTRVGLENTKARLQLIYPHKHDLQLIHTADHFETYLQLKL